MPSNSPIYPDFNSYISSYEKIEDESDAKAIIHKTKEFSELIAERDAYLESNSYIARENIRLKTEYNKIYDQNTSKIALVQKLAARINSLSKEIETIKPQYGYAQIIEGLNAKEAEAASQAAEVYKKFIKKEINYDEFIEEYRLSIQNMKKLQLRRENY